jgi:predicted TIM-barrel fold metal-dependent hydrolase
MSGPIEQEQVRSLCDLHRHANVRVKVSAFYALGEKRPPHLDLSDLIRQVYDSFGPPRLLWGSDCPFQIVNEPYEASIAVIRDRLSFLSPKDREWILYRTAEELFFS